MNKDQVEGRLDQAKGKMKEAAGKVVGNEKLQAEGEVDQASGKVQKTYGDTKEDVKDAVKKGADKLDEQRAAGLRVFREQDKGEREVCND